MDAATYAQHDKYSRTSHSARSVAESRNPFTMKSRKGVDAAITCSITLVAIIAFHISILNEMTKKIGLMFSCIPRQIVCE